MRKRMLRWMLLWAALTAAPAILHAQEGGISRKQQERILAKKAKDEKKAKTKQDKADRERHLSIQDKETRKRMKRHTRRADRRGSGAHRDGFLTRLFSRRR
ncbi:MAG: hypothetical protein IPM46_09550 [Flavobacteriales bacterium]|nr:hypothetical protein [Flavobacteriales bacterium]